MTAYNRNSTRQTCRSRDFYLWKKVARSDGCESFVQLRMTVALRRLAHPLTRREGEPICISKD